MIDTDEKLAEFLNRLRQAKWIALDTEADSLHAYPEKLCLLQISIEGKDELIDPLAPVTLKPLWEIFHEHELILHGADYDLRLFRKIHNFVPTKVFDTMFASRLLGETQFGLTNLVENFLGIALEKGSQKADWARRPLTEKMESYAKNDTRYLKPLSDILKTRLIEKGRLQWHEEVCARLVIECAEVPAIDPDAWRIKGSSQLGGMPLAVLRELWKWREAEATAANKPPYFILSHEAMVAIAAAAGTSRPFNEWVPKHFSTRREETFREALKRGLATTSDALPEIFRP